MKELVTQVDVKYWNNKIKDAEEIKLLEEKLKERLLKQNHEEARNNEEIKLNQRKIKYLDKSNPNYIPTPQKPRKNHFNILSENHKINDSINRLISTEKNGRNLVN